MDVYFLQERQRGRDCVSFFFFLGLSFIFILFQNFPFLSLFFFSPFHLDSKSSLPSFNPFLPQKCCLSKITSCVLCAPFRFLSWSSSLSFSAFFAFKMDFLILRHQYLCWNLLSFFLLTGYLKLVVLLSPSCDKGVVFMCFTCSAS